MKIYIVPEVQLYRTLLTVSILMLASASGCKRPFHDAVPGTVERDRLELIAERSEPIISLPIEEGAAVEAGTVLAKLDPALPLAELAKTKGELLEREARLSELLRGPRVESIERARATLAEREASLAFAEVEVKRSVNLKARGGTTEQEYDRTVAQRDELRAQRAAASEALLELQRGTTVEELDQARARVEAGRAAVTALQMKLDRLEIKAPSAGVVDALPYHLGERPPKGGTVVVFLTASPIYIHAFIPESKKASFAPGSRVRITVDGVQDSLPGKVQWVSHQAAFSPYYSLTQYDRSRLSYEAKIDLLGSQAQLIPSGVPAEILIDTTANLESSNVE